MLIPSGSQEGTGCRRHLEARGHRQGAGGQGTMLDRSLDSTGLGFKSTGQGSREDS